MLSQVLSRKFCLIRSDKWLILNNIADRSNMNWMNHVIDSVLKTQVSDLKSVDESLEECRRVYTSHKYAPNHIKCTVVCT